MPSSDSTTAISEPYKQVVTWLSNMFKGILTVDNAGPFFRWYLREGQKTAPFPQHRNALKIVSAIHGSRLDDPVYVQKLQSDWFGKISDSVCTVLRAMPPGMEHLSADNRDRVVKEFTAIRAALLKSLQYVVLQEVSQKKPLTSQALKLLDDLAKEFPQLEYCSKLAADQASVGSAQPESHSHVHGDVSATFQAASSIASEREAASLVANSLVLAHTIGSSMATAMHERKGFTQNTVDLMRNISQCPSLFYQHYKEGFQQAALQIKEATTAASKDQLMGDLERSIFDLLRDKADVTTDVASYPSTSVHGTSSTMTQQKDNVTVGHLIETKQAPSQAPPSTAISGDTAGAPSLSSGR